MGKNAGITNRSARRDYFILETIEAGLELRGSEVKSIRAGKASLAEGFARIDGNEIFLYQMHISPYEYSDQRDYNPVRPRKLLLHRREIDYLISKISQKGLALVPLQLYFKQGLVKVELAVAKGKKAYDKREAIKRKEAQRDIEKAKRFKR
ncbi:MAG: SsrA-binding protein SmpB [Candidatus Omnitrophica bacterium]|nr:SsrA-binding protein SmpB [Candidatus Omnitrophota bacterium]